MKRRNLSRKEREKLWCRHHMLSSALGLFAEEGYHNISMHKIANKAEFAIGTLYKFFRNKEDLYKALVTEMATDYHRILTEVLAQALFRRNTRRQLQYRGRTGQGHAQALQRTGRAP